MRESSWHDAVYDWCQNIQQSYSEAEKMASEMNKKLIGLYPREMPKPVRSKENRAFLTQPAVLGYDIMAGAKSHVKGPNWRTWNKYESGLIVGEGIPVFSGEKRSQSSPNVSLTQFLSHSWTPPFSYIYAASLLCVVVLYWAQKALHHFRRAEHFEPLSR